MTFFQKLRLGLAVFIEAIGIVFIGFAGYYLIMFVVDTNNPLRHEYSSGIWGGLLYGFACLLTATFLAISIKKTISKKVFNALAVPALIVGIVFLGINFYTVALDLLSKVE